MLEEDFEAFVEADWAAPNGTWAITTDDETGSNVYTQTDTNPSSPLLASSGNVDWTNVIVEADVNVLSFNGTSSSYMAGLCVRLRDADNFYMVGLRSGTTRVQLRALGENATVLVQSEDGAAAVGVWHHLAVQVVGSTITVSVDDAVLFTQVDATHPNGGIGLCTVRASALFDNVRVTAP